MVDELQKENNLLKEINVALSQMLDDQDLATHAKVEASATTAALGTLSPSLHLVRGGGGEWTDHSGLSAVGGRNECSERIMSVSPPWSGARRHSDLPWSCHGTSRFYLISFS